jgi:DNA-binding HxlR family transcriptional regulator
VAWSTQDIDELINVIIFEDKMGHRDNFQDGRPIGYLERSCPVRAAIDVINGRWKPSILEQLHSGPRRYGDLFRSVPTISSQALSLQLRQLSADGIIAKNDSNPGEYTLTDSGRALASVMDGLAAWGEEYLQGRGQRNGSALAAESQHID